jgi:hypothetical protein
VRSSGARTAAVKILRQGGELALGRRPEAPDYLCARAGSRNCGDLHDVIWLIVLSSALIMLWGATDHLDLAGLRQRAARALHLDAWRRGPGHPR